MFFSNGRSRYLPIYRRALKLDAALMALGRVYLSDEVIKAKTLEVFPDVEYLGHGRQKVCFKLLVRKKVVVLKVIKNVNRMQHYLESYTILGADKNSLFVKYYWASQLCMLHKLAEPFDPTNPDHIRQRRLLRCPQLTCQDRGCLGQASLSEGVSMKDRRTMFPSGQTTLSLGRNGVMKTIGVEVSMGSVSNANCYTEIFPVTSKGERGRCKIEIASEACPWTALDAVVEFMNKSKQLPLLMGLHPFLDKLVADKLAGKSLWAQ
jgi:hypothetical protein